MCSHAGRGIAETRGDSPERFLTSTLARCFPCAPGEFCPAGTYTDPSASANTQLMARRCPPGSYCPSPSQQILCEAGTYCVGGSLEPFSCDLSGLLQQDALADVPQPKQTLIEQLYEKGDPLGGNFCPEQAVTPAGTCAPTGVHLHMGCLCMRVHSWAETSAVPHYGWADSIPDTLNWCPRIRRPYFQLL